MLKFYECLKQAFEKNIYKEPKCYLCKNTKYTCSTSVAIILGIILFIL
jgi:hypothetical protein